MESYQLRYRNRTTRQRSRVLRIIGVAVGIAILVSGSGFTSVALRKPAPPLIVSVDHIQHPNSKPEITWPARGQAAIGTTTEGLLAVSNGDVPAQPIASVAKIITALAVLTQKPLEQGIAGPTITIGRSDVERYNYYLSNDGSNVPVALGEQLSEYEALEALLLPSANNIADTLAVWAFGSMDAYVTYANSMVKSYGLTRTTIADASGFSPNTVSTAADLVIIGQQALKQPVLKEIVAKQEATIPVAGVIKNTNKLLGTESIIGMKTGHTHEAGGCLLFAATQKIDSTHESTIIGAVVGDTSLSNAFTAARTILASATDDFGATVIADAGKKVGMIKTAWGQQTPVVTQAALVSYGWKHTAHSASTTLNHHAAPITTGSTIGRMSVGDKSINLVPQQAISPPSNLWKLLHYF
jgi:D-alanyl-D-alanine carboxypeptidase (penicillin-binding protein 5/6)